MKAQVNLRFPLLVCLIVVLVSSACFPFTIGQQPAGPDAIYTSAAQTVIAQATLSTGQTAIAMLTQMALGTPVQLSPILPTQPTTATPTALPTYYFPPTATFIYPSMTPVPPTRIPPPPPPPPTQVPPPCDWAQYVADVTIPDNTLLAPGTGFTKVWRMRNIGSCSWNASYSLVFVEGDRMQAPNTVPLPGVVHPGQTVDLAVNLIAPATAGDYRGYWMLANPYGRTFGIGQRANKAFWVDIRVSAPNPQYAYDFAAYMCSAAWSNDSGRGLPCPGNTTGAEGSVALLLAPDLETGRHENEPALWMRPRQAQNGSIRGVYPAYRVQAGDRFVSEIGCLENSSGCDVIFRLDYQIPGQPVRNIGEWREVYDRNATRLDLDLSGLAGQQAQFILSVTNNGQAARANAYWFVPSIRHGSVPPTPTPTRTPTPTATQDWSTNPAVQSARNIIAQAAGVPVDQVIVVSATAVQWTDTCLGIYPPPPGQICAPALIPGYRVILQVGSQGYEAHTNQDGSIVVWFLL